MLLRSGRNFTSSNLRNFPSSSTTQTCCSISLLTYGKNDVQWVSYEVSSKNIIIFKDRNSPRSFRQLELLQVWWESAWKKTVETELNESGDLERQLFTLQVLPSPWGKLRRTWRSVGQVGNCLARASPRLDVAIFLENILWIPTRTWGSKPMSNILSASSRIIMVIRRRLVTWK